MSRTRIILIVIAFVVVNTLGLSLTLVNKGSYKNSLYHRFTRQRFAWITSDLGPKYPIRAGWANQTIIPTGSIGSDRKTQDSVQTRALVLDNGTTQAVMISVDLPIMPPTVAQALEQRLPKIGFAWKNVYLGSTYSQGSLGGWTNDVMGHQQAGSYDPQRVIQLTEAIVKAVTVAKTNMATVQIGYSTVDLNGQKPTVSDHAQAERLHLLQLRKTTGKSALIYTGYIDTIPTDKGKESSNQISFLRQLTQQLDQQAHCFTLSMTGSIKSNNRLNSPKQKDPQVLAAQLATLLAKQSLHTDSTLIAQTAPLIQNDPHIRISQNWRLKPWLAKALYGDYPAELKALRIGQTVFVGCPGGVSPELTTNLLALPVAEQRQLVITSYNGGNIGQIVPDTFYYASNSPYALSQINRFGPHTSEFFEDMTQSLVSSLK